MPIASRVEPANVSDRKAGYRLLGGLRFAFPNIQTVIADAGHESRKLAWELRRHGHELRIVRRKDRAFKVTNLDRGTQLGMARKISSAEQGLRIPRSKSEAMIDLAATRIMLNRIAHA